MNNQFYRPVNNRGFQSNRKSNLESNIIEGKARITGRVDENLIIEDNTIYEIDRECYTKYRKQKRRKP